MKMEPLAKPAIEAVRRRARSSSCPSASTRTTINWMENIRDWCISRQLWWGHRIPAWYCDDCGEIIVGRGRSHRLPQVRQHPSAPGRGHAGHLVLLRPVALLHPGLAGRDAEDLEYFYPTNTLVTGYDIIFFWVARMIFSGLELHGQGPVRHRAHPRPGARRPGPQDVQDPWATASTRWRSSTSTAPTPCA